MHEILLRVIWFYKKHPVVAWILTIFIVGLTSGIILLPLSLFGVVVSVYYLVYFIKTLKYYGSEDFISLKSKLVAKISEYNEFDDFMDETRAFIREHQGRLTSSNVKHSTLTVYKNTTLDVYRYIVKYFFTNTKIDEETMQVVEAILQKYNTINKTYEILTDEYGALMKYVQKNMYRGAYIFKGLTMKRLGSRKLPKFEKDYFMRYAFVYDSPTNRKHYSNTITLDEVRLESFAEYLNALIRHRASAKYQRQLMTPSLRELILARDHYACKYCGMSKAKQSHLLLEVDHIQPISQGGITAIQNLQSLCWKCNRSKGSKFDPALTTA